MRYGQARHLWLEITQEDYREILSGVSGHYSAIYGFVIFSADVLDIDTCEVIRTADYANGIAKEYVDRAFSNLPRSGNAEIAASVLGDSYNDIWNRLKCT